MQTLAQPYTQIEEWLLDYLRTMADMERQCNRSEELNLYQRMLNEGQFFKPDHLLRGYRLGKVKECFYNAANLVLFNNDDELRYVEGIAYSGLIPTPHAWAIDIDNRVIDNTWRTRGKYGCEPEKKAYFGIIVPTDELRKEILRTKIWGMFWK